MQVQCHRSLMPFFSSSQMIDRLNKIRQVIQFVRKKENYTQQKFHRYMKIFAEKLQQEEDKEFVLSIPFTYWDQKNLKQKRRFDFIKMYTMERANQTLIRQANNILRALEIQYQNLQWIVFLIQALNIELFLLTQVRAYYNQPEFLGKVFRGFTCSIKDAQLFQQELKKPIQNRVISVPLSLWASSTDINVAFDFLSRRRNKDFPINIILAIQVIGLDANDLKTYNESFPESVVSTICAVDIQKIFKQYEPQMRISQDPTKHQAQNLLSQYPKQKQILLRGAFCLILDIQEKAYIYKDKRYQYKMINCVTVNANRDHISTNNLGKMEDPARQMFASMTIGAGVKFAQKYFNQKYSQQNQTKENQQRMQVYKSQLQKANKRFQEAQKQAKSLSRDDAEKINKQQVKKYQNRNK